MAFIEGFEHDILLKMSIYIIQITVGLFGVCFALYWLYQAFAHGRVLGYALITYRATQPVRFWINVIGMFMVLAVFSMMAALPVMTASLPMVKSRWGFHALHSIADSATMAPSPVAASATPGCDSPEYTVCFVAAGAAPDVPVETLARYYTTLLGAPVGVLASVALTREADDLPLVNTKRSQVGIDALTRLVRDTYPALWGKGVTVVILTGNDLWLEDRSGWQFSFGGATGRRGGGGVAVVSSARMDPAAYGKAPDPEVLERRVHAMVGKYLALLLYGESASSDPASPVYDAIGSPADLDRMRPFAPPK